MTTTHSIAKFFHRSQARPQRDRACLVNSTHRPRYLLSGLLECGVCGGSYAKRGQDRYGCSNHVMSGSCANSRSIQRVEIEERVMAGLRDKLMEPKAAAEAMKAYAEETNRLNRERRASGATDRRELVDIEKKIKAMVAVVAEAGFEPARAGCPPPYAWRAVRSSRCPSSQRVLILPLT